jgi:hypothetical protein
MADYASSPVITGTNVTGSFAVSNVAELSDGSLVYIATTNGQSSPVYHMVLFRSTNNGQSYTEYCRFRRTTSNSSYSSVVISAKGMKVAFAASWNSGTISFLGGIDLSVVPQGTVNDNTDAGGAGWWATFTLNGYDASRPFGILYGSDDRIYIAWHYYINYSEDDDQYYYFNGAFSWGSPTALWTMRANEYIWNFQPNLSFSIVEYKGRVIFSVPVENPVTPARFLTVPLGTSTLEYHTFTGGFSGWNVKTLLVHPTDGYLYIFVTNNQWEFRMYRTSDISGSSIAWVEHAPQLYTATTNFYFSGAQMSPSGEIWVFYHYSQQNTSGGVYASVFTTMGTKLVDQWHLISNPSGNFSLQSQDNMSFNRRANSTQRNTTVAIVQGYPTGYNQHRTWTRTYNNAPSAPNVITPVHNSYQTTTDPTFSWFFQDPDAGNSQSAWQIQVSKDSTFANVGLAVIDSGKVTGASGGAQSWVFYGLPQGQMWYRIKTWDNSDVEGPWSPVYSFTVDTIKPTSAGVNPPQYLNLSSGTFRVWAYNVVDSGSGMNRVQFPTSNITATGGATWIWFDGIKDGATNNWYCDIPLSSFGNAEGLYYTDPYAYDNAGNLLNTGRIDTWIDRTIPTAPTQTNGVLYATSNGVSWTAFSDGAASSGLLLTSLYLQKWNGSTWVTESGYPKSVAGLTYNFTGLTPATQYRWGVTYTDNASNVSALSYTTFTTNAYAVTTQINMTSSGAILNQRPRLRFTVTDANDATLTNVQIRISNASNFATTIIDTAIATSSVGWSASSYASGATGHYTPQINIGTGLKYVQIRAFDGKDWGAWSATVSFTVNATSWVTTIAADDTAISKRTIDEIRTKLNLLRQARGLAAAVWTDSVIVDWNGVTPTNIRTTHLIELRQAIADVYTALSQTAPTWTDTIIDTTINRKGQHWTELRNAIAAA